MYHVLRVTYLFIYDFVSGFIIDRYQFVEFSRESCFVNMWYLESSIVDPGQFVGKQY